MFCVCQNNKKKINESELQMFKKHWFSSYSCAVKCLDTAHLHIVTPTIVHKRSSARTAGSMK